MISRRAFTRTLGGIFVPTLLLQRKALGQFATFGDLPFMAGTTADCGTSGTSFATSWANQVVTNGGASPSAGTQTAIANFQCGLIMNGLDSQMIAWNAFAADNLTAARTPQLAGNGGVLWTNHNFVGGDLTTAGLTGDAATKFLDTNGDPVGAATNAQSIGSFVYTTAVAASANGRSFGVLNSDFQLIAAKDNTGNTFGANGGNPSNVLSTATHGNGFYTDQRINSVDHRIYFANGSNALAQIGSTDGTQYSSGLPATSYYVFALNNGGSAFGLTAETIGMVGITKGLSSGQASTLFGLIQTLMTAFGRNV